MHTGLHCRRVSFALVAAICGFSLFAIYYDFQFQYCNSGDGRLSGKAGLSVPSHSNVSSWNSHRSTKEVCSALTERLISDYVPIQKRFLTKGEGKVLVWRCGEIQCGGLGDRLRGIITTFLQAVLTGRAFLIDHSRPSKLDEFFDFNSDAGTSWHYDKKYLIGKKQSGERNLDQYQESKYRYRTENFLQTLKAPVHIVQTNLPVQSYLLWNQHLEKAIRQYGFDHINYIDLTGCLLDFLLEPRGALKQALEKSRDELAGHYVIGIQIRTGGDNTGAWKDVPRVPRSDVGYFWRCAQSIESWVTEQYSRENKTLSFKWFVTTDSELVRKEAMEKLGDKIYQVPGDIVHIDLFESETASKGMLKTLMDFLLLSEAQNLVISRSNFAEVAALRNFHHAFMYPDVCERGHERSDFTRWWHADQE